MNLLKLLEGTLELKADKIKIKDQRGQENSALFKKIVERQKMAFENTLLKKLENLQEDNKVNLFDGEKLIVKVIKSLNNIDLKEIATKMKDDTKVENEKKKLMNRMKTTKVMYEKGKLENKILMRKDKQAQNKEDKLIGEMKERKGEKDEKVIQKNKFAENNLIDEVKKDKKSKVLDEENKQEIQNKKSKFIGKAKEGKDEKVIQKNKFTESVNEEKKVEKSLKFVDIKENRKVVEENKRSDDGKMFNEKKEGKVIKNTKISKKIVFKPKTEDVPKEFLNSRIENVVEVKDELSKAKERENRSILISGKIQSLGNNRKTEKVVQKSKQIENINSREIPVKNLKFEKDNTKINEANLIKRHLDDNEKVEIRDNETLIINYVVKENSIEKVEKNTVLSNKKDVVGELRKNNKIALRNGIGGLSSIVVANIKVNEKKVSVLLNKMAENKVVLVKNVVLNKSQKDKNRIPKVSVELAQEENTVILEKKIAVGIMKDKFIEVKPQVVVGDEFTKKNKDLKFVNLNDIKIKYFLWSALLGK